MPPTNRASRREELAQMKVPEVPSLPLLAIGGYLCFRCFENHPNLAKCKGCQRASYCSKECQAEDWRIVHRRACKALQDINDIETRETADGISWEGYKDSTYHKTMLMKNHTKKLGKNPAQDLAQIVAAQPYCTSCHLTGFQLSKRSTTLTTCAKCKMISWCSRCPKKHTEDQCQQYSIISDLELYRLRRFEQGSGVSVISPVGKPFTAANYRALSSINGWPDFFKTIPLSIQGEDPDLIDQELHPAMITDSSTMTLTVLAALEATIPDLVTKKDLTIHLIGASGREVNHLLLLEDFLHLLPNLKHLHAVLCGPNVPYVEASSTGDLGQDMELDSCPPCNSMGKRKSAAFYPGLYHDYVRRPAYRKPDLAVLFHSGRTQEAVESWKPTTRFLVNEGMPTVCTTYTRSEMNEEVAELDSLGAKFVLRPEENKWRSLVPWPEVLEGEEHSAWYFNSYWYIFHGKTGK